MTELNSLQQLAVSELDRLTGELRMINSCMNPPHPIMTDHTQKTSQ